MINMRVGLLLNSVTDFSLTVPVPSVCADVDAQEESHCHLWAPFQRGCDGGQEGCASGQAPGACWQKCAQPSRDEGHAGESFPCNLVTVQIYSLLASCRRLQLCLRKDWRSQYSPCYRELPAQYLPCFSSYSFECAHQSVCRTPCLRISSGCLVWTRCSGVKASLGFCDCKLYDLSLFKAEAVVVKP